MTDSADVPDLSPTDSDLDAQNLEVALTVAVLRSLQRRAEQ